MPRFSFTSLRSRAIFLVLLALLPLLALTLYSYYAQRERAIREVQRDELVAAKNLAIIQENMINSALQLMTSLARLPEVQRRDRDACSALFAKLMRQNPQYTIIAAADPEGWSFASAPAAPGPISYADRLWFQKTVQTRTFFMGEPLFDRVSGKYNFNLAYPILDDQGRVQGVVAVGLDLHWLGSLLAKSDFPPTTALVLTDLTNKVLFRYPEPLEYIGRMLPDFLIKAIAGRDEGVAEGVGLPGDARLFAFVRLSPPWQEICLVIGLPKNPALDRVNRNLLRNLLWLGLVGFLSLAAAWYGSGLFILQPVRKLRGVTEQLAAGDLTVRAGPDYTVGELGLLAHAFDGMADSLEARDHELKKTAEELRQRVRELDRRTMQLEAANKEMEAFTYSVSHDLRAPLRSIGGFARVLLEDYPDKLDADGKRYLNIIHQDARKMGQLIDDLLALSRLGRKEMRLGRINIAELARGIFAELRGHYPERELQIEIQPLPEAHGDEVMIRQVLTNLLVNAIKFTKDRDPALIQVSGWSEEHDHIYCVRDNGVGFDMKYVNKLFEVFQRLHSEEEFEGTGVGLAIVKRIIDRHGGRLWAEGKVNEGATFCFTIPQ